MVNFPHIAENVTAGSLTTARLLFLAALFAFLTISALAVPQINTIPEGDTIEIQDAPEMQVIAFAKTVIIKKRAKEVFVFGGDVVIEGSVENDVGVIGGTVIQKEGASIGGDVIAIGGAYKAESMQPIRTPGKETIVFGIFEEELREMGRDPSTVLSPSLTPAFLAQRLLSAIFWFIVGLGLTTIAPGAVGRAIARIQLSTLAVAGFGLAGMIASVVIVILGVSYLPDYLGALVWLMIFGLLMLAYLFGRVTLQLSVGKLIQKHLFPGYKHNETVAILIGVLVWTALLSLPYVWPLALLALFSAGVGLVLTARNGGSLRPS